MPNTPSRLYVISFSLATCELQSSSTQMETQFKWSPGNKQTKGQKCQGSGFSPTPTPISLSTTVKYRRPFVDSKAREISHTNLTDYGQGMIERWLKYRGMGGWGVASQVRGLRSAMTLGETNLSPGIRAIVEPELQNSNGHLNTTVGKSGCKKTAQGDGATRPTLQSSSQSWLCCASALGSSQSQFSLWPGRPGLSPRYLQF